MARKDERPDEFCDDGKTRKLNRSKSHGVVYADGFEETKFVQNGIGYRGDGTPVGYVPAADRGEPVVVPPVEEVLAENEQLKRQIAALMKRVDALETAKPASGTGLPPPPKESTHAGGGSKRV
jgi:hypothetical protein